MKIFIALRHSTAYYDEYTEDKFLGAYRIREEAVRSVLMDMSNMPVFMSEIANARSEFCNHGNNSYRLWEIKAIRVD
jgi:hypothetical protein